MYYLADNPWPAIVVLGGLAICAFVLGHPALRKVGVLLAFLAGLVYAADAMIESPRERVEVSANKMLSGFQAADLNAIDAMISRQSPDLMETARRGLELVSIEPGFHIKSVELKSASSNEVVARIRANGRITERKQSMTQHVPEYWETIWVQEDDQWKLSEATRLDPLSGQPRGTFDRN